MKEKARVIKREKRIKYEMKGNGGKDRENQLKKEKVKAKKRGKEVKKSEKGKDSKREKSYVKPAS